MQQNAKRADFPLHFWNIMGPNSPNLRENIQGKTSKVFKFCAINLVTHNDIYKILLLKGLELSTIKHLFSV